MENKEKFGCSFSFTTVLFLIFLVLKLTDAIDWSWWWVTSPLWLPWVVIVGIIGIVVTLIAIFNK